MINLHKSMGSGPDLTRDPWICSQTRICSQTGHQLRYKALSLSDGMSSSWLLDGYLKLFADMSELFVNEAEQMPMKVDHPAHFC